MQEFTLALAQAVALSVQLRSWLYKLPKITAQLRQPRQSSMPNDLLSTSLLYLNPRSPVGLRMVHLSQHMASSQTFLLLRSSNLKSLILKRQGRSFSIPSRKSQKSSSHPNRQALLWRSFLTSPSPKTNLSHHCPESMYSTPCLDSNRSSQLARNTLSGVQQYPQWLQPFPRLEWLLLFEISQLWTQKAQRP